MFGEKYVEKLRAEIKKDKYYPPVAEPEEPYDGTKREKP
jgi:hypothetical protein